MKIKKIAFLVAGINAGGTENYLLRFIKYYSKEIDATVYCKSGKLGELEDEFRATGAKLIPFKLGYFSITQFIALKNEFQNEKYDAVCDLTGSFGAIPLLMAKYANISKRVAFFRNSREKFTKTPLKVAYSNFITSLLPKVATKVLSNSKNALDYFYGNLWKGNVKFDVIYNGIDATNFLISKEENLRSELAIPQNAFVVGHVGRLNEQKNHPTLIQVALSLVEKYNDVYFIFCGKNVGEKYATEIANKKGAERILFLGVRRDVNKVLNTLNCFYFPSLIEGQPNALIEALILGIPFVASDIEPIKETIPTEFHEQLVHPLDDKSALIKIDILKKNLLDADKLNLSKWAINYYDPKKWFDKFNTEL